MKSIQHRDMLFAAVLAMLVSAAFCSIANAETVTVDFGVDKGPVTYRASGFLHGVSYDGTPPDAKVLPLKPKLFRDDYSCGAGGVVYTYNRMKSLGATHVQAVITSGGTPWSDPNWYSTCYWTVYDAINTRGYTDIEWDPLNEPDNPGFYSGPSLANLESAWQTAYSAITSADPNATIVGPSLMACTGSTPTEQWNNAKAWIQPFLLSCRANNCLPNVLSWHENVYPEYTADHVAEMKTWMAAQNPVINISRISINEYCGYWNVAHPGPIVRHLVSIEASDAYLESAAHTCWDGQDIAGTCSCCSHNLCNELVASTYVPRAGWWAIKGYGMLAGNRKQVTSGATTYGLASTHSGMKVARVLLGRNSGSDADAITLQVNNILPNHSYLVRNNAVRVVVERIPDSPSHNALASLTKTWEGNVSIVSNGITVPITSYGQFAHNDAYIVKIFKPSAICDADNDGDTDIGEYVNSSGQWIAYGIGTLFSGGQNCDIPLWGDFNNDGLLDAAVNMKTAGSTDQWHIDYSGSTPNLDVSPWGQYYDVPVVGDYDGDGDTDFGVWHPTTGGWDFYGLGSGGPWGSNGAVPLCGDFDGDSKYDMAVCYPGNPPSFSIWNTGGGSWGVTQTGVTGGVPICGDFDGDNRADFGTFDSTVNPCVFRIYGIGDTTLGVPGDIPILGDYNGDGRTDYAVYRPGAPSQWHVKYSVVGGTLDINSWGWTGRVPFACGVSGWNGIITAHPYSQTVGVGANVYFSVTAWGSGLTYQWYRNGSAIGGATSYYYNRLNVQRSDSGSTYYCQVTNWNGCVKRSATATLTVN